MRLDKTTQGKKIIVKSLFTIFVLGALSAPIMTVGMKSPKNPLSHKAFTKSDDFVESTFTETQTITIDPPDIFEMIPEFVTTPDGGIPWDVFNETIEHEYQYEEDSEFVYMGVRPEFSKNLKKLEGSVITLQGYMFPLDQGETQKRFLLGPFPASCPYHYHIPPKLVLEANLKNPAKFSYDAINVKGTLELIPKDDEYNLFYKLNDAELVQ